MPAAIKSLLGTVLTAAKWAFRPQAQYSSAWLCWRCGLYGPMPVRWGRRCGCCRRCGAALS